MPSGVLNSCIFVMAGVVRWEGARWVSQSSNKAEVGELITDAIGLSREQFTQVMLLPQGEFARFLRSDDDARRRLQTLEQRDEELARINLALEKLNAELMRVGKDLSNKRQKLIPQLSKSVSKQRDEIHFFC